MAAGAMEACILVDPQHCANSGEPCAAAMACDPCTPSNVMAKGCVDAGAVRDLEPDTPGCQAADGGTTIDPTVGEESTVTTTGTSTSMTTMTTVDLDTTVTEGPTDTTETTGPPPPCDEPDGTFGETCSGSTPFCVGGECVPCSSEDPLTTCAEDPELVCAPSGACVVCSGANADACTGETPVCNPATNLCVPCTEHAQCGPAACNLFTGACVEGMVVSVGVGQMQPNITGAMALIGAGGGTIVIHDGTYNEAVTVLGGPIVAFLANDGDRPTWQRTMGAGAPQLRVSASSTVFIDGIDLRSNPAPGDPALRVDGASLWVDRAVIAQNTAVAVVADTSAELVLRNCFVAGVNALPALNVTTGSSATIEYSTLVAGFSTATAISCDGSSDVTVSDSIVVSQGANDVACNMLTADHSAANSMLPGDGNIGVGMTMSTWFTNINTGNFHLTGPGPDAFVDVAEWNLGDATVDIDGSARSGVEGTLEHAGADLP